MDAVEEIKSRLAIEDVISEYVQLKRAGRNFRGNSPFTNEKTPSFMVSPEKQIWHDFSSGKGGNVFSFVMEMEGLDFKGALELLARKAGVDIDQRRSSTRNTNKTKERLYEALELAAKFYQTQFSHHTGALDYVFKERKFTKDIVLQFQLGYAPNNGNALIDFMVRKSFTESELQQAGLMVRRYGGMGDMFRGRLMIPLADAQGRVIGFTARQLDADPHAPKYINTPQTPLYDKSRHVYGLHLAKGAIRTTGYVVVVEGNLDVIASHQIGATQVVATAGTAMTENHLKILKRFTSDIRISFDQDKAGQSAVERTIPLANKADINLGVITIADAKDPDELIKKDPSKWLNSIEQKQYAVDWLIDRYKASLDITTVQGKRIFTDTLMAVIKQLPDTIEQEHYLKLLAKTIDASEEAITEKFKNKGLKQPTILKRSKVIKPHDKRVIDILKTQNQLLAITFMRPSLRQYLIPITREMLLSDEAIELLEFLHANPDFTGHQTEMAPLRKIADYVKILGLQYEALYQELDELELNYEVSRLQVRLIDQYVKTKKIELSAAMHSADDTTMAKLLQQAKKLDELLKFAKEVTNG
ncbi:MAG: DNA primase [Candidatus Saccharimonadales bacterium]